jgi:uridine kinase
MTRHVKNTHLDKLLDTEVVDHPVEEYVTRAQMIHDSPFDEADVASVDVSVLSGSVC